MREIGVLMAEHRIIEKMVGLLKAEYLRVEQGGAIDDKFIEQAGNFFINYADKIHHGKEEYILFSYLQNKKLSAEHTSILQRLISDHENGRELVSELIGAKEVLKNNKEEARKIVLTNLQKLINLYPEHIRIEDKKFFMPMSKYFSIKEKEEIANKFKQFTADLNKEKYEKLVVGAM